VAIEPSRARDGAHRIGSGIRAAAIASAWAAVGGSWPDPGGPHWSRRAGWWHGRARVAWIRAWEVEAASAHQEAIRPTLPLGAIAGVCGLAEKSWRLIADPGERSFSSVHGRTGPLQRCGPWRCRMSCRHRAGGNPPTTNSQVEAPGDLDRRSGLLPAGRGPEQNGFHGQGFGGSHRVAAGRAKTKGTGAGDKSRHGWFSHTPHRLSRSPLGSPLRGPG